MDAPSSDDAWTPLPGKARTLFYAQAFLRLVLFWFPVVGVGVAVLASQWQFLGAVGVGAALLFLRFVIALWMPALAHSRWAYTLRRRELVVSHGVLFRTITAVPTPRVQHVDVRQGPLEQTLGLARIQVYTASGMGADAVIPGLELATAEALRDQLVQVDGDDGV